MRQVALIFIWTLADKIRSQSRSLLRHARNKIEKNRQILTRLRRFLQTSSNEFRICVSEVRATLLKLNENEEFACDLLEESEENNSSSDFLDALDTSDVIVDEWKTLILNNATIFESIDEMTTRKHIHEHNAIYDDKIIDNLVELIRSLLKKNSCAIQVRQKLIIFEKSHSSWKNEREILWHDDCLYVSSNLRKNVIKSNHDNLLIDHFDVERILKLIRRKYYWFN